MTSNAPVRVPVRLEDITGLGANDIAPLMTTLAQLHAAHWGAPDLGRQFDWLETAAEGNTARWWIQESRPAAEYELGQPYKIEALDLDANRWTVSAQRWRLCNG